MNSIQFNLHTMSFSIFTKSFDIFHQLIITNNAKQYGAQVCLCKTM
jgi:hypothetical protein